MKKECVRIFLMSLGIFGALASSPARAQTDPCILDEANLCGTIDRGKGRIFTCMVEHLEDLSPACQKSIAKIDKHVQRARNACAPDIQHYCAMEPQDALARIKCLKAWKNQLIPECRKHYDKLLALPIQPDY